MSDRNVSKLSEHTINKGRVITPLNNSLGDVLQLGSWTTDRLPEYVWLALILSYYGREDGLNRANQILFSLSRLDQTLQRPKLSSIFGLSKEKRNDAFQLISDVTAPEVLSPLTIIYRNEDYSDFNSYFFVPTMSFEKRIEALQRVVKDYGPHQSNEATDLRFLAVEMPFFHGNAYTNETVQTVVDAIKNYPNTSHDDEKMRLYRPTIRSMEGIDFEGSNQAFIEHFWRELGSITECNLMYIDFNDQSDLPIEYLDDTKRLFKEIVLENKEKTLSDPKFEVIVGTAVYIFKLFTEVIENNLRNRILGRHALRTMIEAYIMIKYILKRESEKPNIWFEYQLYGISKYKMTLLKAREMNIVESTHHFALPVIDALVNEKLWEEFIDVDLRYFDRQGIRDKSIFVDEKDLYDLYYEYDTNFVHGFWGSVRESSMLFCDNATHKHHNVPDIEFNQNLLSIQSDILMVMRKVIRLVAKVYHLPEWYKDKYDVMR